MRKRFVIKLFKEENLFIGIGFILGDEYIGLTINNLFIGIKKEKE
ncbi:MAG: hypothetical protein ACFFAU_01530 [Candidatus Hodarchaeota archaeon]